MISDLQLPGVVTEVLADDDTVAVAAAARIMAAATDAIAANGRFRICLAGGSTPAAAYRLLAQRSETDWSAWHIYYGDERCVPPDDEARNSLAAERAWLGQVPVPHEQIHAIPAERGAEAGAAAYEPVVEAALPFDLVLLGIGEDGHTASLFPGRPVPEDRLVMSVGAAPKPPPERVSLTPAALSDCRALLVLATGTGKSDALARWRDGEALPIALVAEGAPTLVLLDRAALPGG